MTVGTWFVLQLALAGIQPEEVPVVDVDCGVAIADAVSRISAGASAMEGEQHKSFRDTRDRYAGFTCETYGDEFIPGVIYLSEFYGPGKRRFIYDRETMRFRRIKQDRE